MATIREIAEKLFAKREGRLVIGWKNTGYWSFRRIGEDSVDDELLSFTREIAEAALREFGEELAKLCEAEAVDFAATKDEGDRAYNLATEHCAEHIRAAIRESL